MHDITPHSFFLPLSTVDVVYVSSALEVSLGGGCGVGVGVGVGVVALRLDG